MAESVSPEVTPPDSAFNFAQHLLGLNETRSGKTAFIDDSGALSYGDLAERVLGHQPRSLERTLDETFAWFRQRGLLPSRARA